MPDEEIGSGTASFDLSRFQEDCAYTVAGWEAGEIEGGNLQCSAGDCAAARRIELLQQAAATLNHRWGKGAAQIRCTEEYRNMKEKMDEHLQLVEKARFACLAAGITPHVVAARGGTDGARLTYAGLPCPNLGLGGWAYHSPYEHITQEAMEQVTAILRVLIFLFAEAESI